MVRLDAVDPIAVAEVDMPAGRAGVLLIDQVELGQHAAETDVAVAARSATGASHSSS